MNCHLLRRHLDAFVDGEVDPSTQIEFERHLAACVACEERLRFARACKAEVRRQGATMMAPAALRAKVAETLASPIVHREDKHDEIKVIRLPRRYGIAFAAAALLGSAFFGSAFWPKAGGKGVSHASAVPLLEDVVRVHSSGLPVDVPGSQREQLANYFHGKVEFPVRPARFVVSGSEEPHLVGARLSNVQAYRAAALYYDMSGRRMTVVVFSTRDPFDLPVRNVGGRRVYFQRVGGYAVSAVEDDGLMYAITGDMDPQTILRLAANARVY